MHNNKELAIAFTFERIIAFYQLTEKILLQQRYYSLDFKPCLLLWIPDIECVLISDYEGNSTKIAVIRWRKECTSLEDLAIEFGSERQCAKLNKINIFCWCLTEGKQDKADSKSLVIYDMNTQGLLKFVFL